MFPELIQKKVYSNAIVWLIEGCGEFLVDKVADSSVPERLKNHRSIANMLDALFSLHKEAGILFPDLKYDWICNSNVDSGLTWIFDGLSIPKEDEIVCGEFYGGCPQKIRNSR